MRMELYNTDTKPNMAIKQRDKQSTTKTTFRCSRTNSTSTSTKKILFLSKYQIMSFIITFLTLFLISGIESTTSTTTTSRPTNNDNIGGKDKADKPVGILLDTLSTTNLTLDMDSSVSKTNKGDENNDDDDDNVLIRKRNVPADDDHNDAPTNDSPTRSTTTTTFTPDIDSSKSNKGDEHNDNNNVLIRKRNVPHDDNAPTNASPNESTTATTTTFTPDTDKFSSKSNKGDDDHNDNDDDNDNVLISKRNVPDHHTPTNDSPTRSATTPTTPTHTPTQGTVTKVRVQPEVEQPPPPPRDDFALILENYIMYKQLLRKKRSLRNRILQLARHDNINIDSGNDNEKTQQHNKNYDGGNNIDSGIITANNKNLNNGGFEFDLHNNLNRKDEEKSESRRQGLVFPPFIHNHHRAMPPFVANEFNRKHHVLTLKDIKRVLEGHHQQNEKNMKTDMDMNVDTGSIPPTPVPHVVPWSSPMYWMWHPSVFNNRHNDRQALMHLLRANRDPIQAIKDMMTRRLAMRRNVLSTSTAADTTTRLVKQNIMEKRHHLNTIHNNNHEHNDDMLRNRDESNDDNNNDYNAGSDVNADDNNDEFAFQMILSSDSNSNSNPIKSNRNNLNNINIDSDIERNVNNEEEKDGSSVFMLKLNDIANPFGESSGDVGSLDHHRAPFSGFLGQLISSIVNQNNNDDTKSMKNFIREMIKKNFHNIIYGKKNKKNKNNETHHKHIDNNGKGHNHNHNHNHSKSKSGHHLKSTKNHQHHNNKGNEHTDDEINRDKKLHNDNNNDNDKNHHTDRQIVHHHNKLDGEKDHNQPEAEVHPTNSNDGIAIQNSKEMIKIISQTHSNKTEPPKQQRPHRNELITIASIKQYFNSNNENDNITKLSTGGYNIKVDTNTNNGDKDDENKNNEKNKIDDNDMVNRNYSTLKPNSSPKVSDTQQNTELNLVQKMIDDLNEVDVKVKGEAIHQQISGNENNVENSKYGIIKENIVDDFKNNNLNHDNIIADKEGHENKKKNTTQEIVDDAGKNLDNKKNTVKQMNIKKEKEQKQTNKMLFKINSSVKKHNVLFENDNKIDLEKEFPGAEIEEPISQRDLTQGHNDNDNIEDFKQRTTRHNINIEQVHQNILLNQAVKRMKNELRQDIVDKTIPEPQQYPFMNSMAFEDNENENRNENNMGRRRGNAVGEDEIMNGDYFLPQDNVNDKNNNNLNNYDSRSILKKEKQNKGKEQHEQEHNSNNRFYKLSHHEEKNEYPQRNQDQESLKLKREFVDSEEARIAPETHHQQLLNFNQDNNNNNNNNNNNMFISKTRRSMRLRRSSDASSSSTSSSNHKGINNSEHISSHHKTPSSHGDSDSNIKSKVDDHKTSLNGDDVAMLLIKTFPQFNNDDNNNDNNGKDNKQPLKNSIEHNSESQESDNVHHNTKGKEVNKKKGDKTLSDTAATDSDDRIPFIPSLDGVMRTNDDNSGSSSGPLDQQHRGRANLTLLVGHHSMFGPNHRKHAALGLGILAMLLLMVVAVICMASFGTSNQMSRANSRTALYRPNDLYAYNNTRNNTAGDVGATAHNDAFTYLG